MIYSYNKTKEMH